MEYVLIKISDSSVQKFTDSDREGPNFPPDLTQKDLSWHPVIRNPAPPHDPAIEKVEANNGLVGNDYVFDFNVVAKTAQEQTDFIQNQDIDFVLNGLLDVAEIVIIHVDAHLAKGNIVAADFNAATRQKYIDLKQRVDRLRGA